MKRRNPPVVDTAGNALRLARFAVSLFDRETARHREELPTTLLDELPTFFSAHQLAFLALPGSTAADRLLQRPLVAEAYHAESRRFARLRAEFELVRRAWSEAGIEPLLLKAGAGTPSFPHLSGNLDVLIPPSAAGPAHAALARLGFIELPRLREPHKLLYKLFRQGEEACAVHLHLRVEWCVSFLFEERVWEKRRPAPDDSRLAVPSPEDALLVTIAHALYENKQFRVGDALRVSGCVGGPGLDWGYVWNVAVSKGWGDGLAFGLLCYESLQHVLGGLAPLSVAETAECHRRLRGALPTLALRRLRHPGRIPCRFGFASSKALFFAKILRDRTEPVRARLCSALYHLASGSMLKLGLQTRQRFLVAISGVDGAGKSTIAEAVHNAFRQCGLSVRTVWSRGGSSRLAAALIALGKRLVKDDGRSAPRSETLTGEARRAVLLRHPLVRALWPWLVTVELAWLYTWKVRLPLMLGEAVVCDRFVADALAELSSRLGSEAGASSLPTRVLRALAPRADAAIYLAVAPGTAAARSEAQREPEALELVERHRAALELMARRGELTRYDAEHPLALLTDVVLHDVLQELSSRAQPWGSGLLVSRFDPPPRASHERFEPAETPTPIPCSAQRIASGDGRAG